MSRFASGKKAYGISDRSGLRYPLRQMRREWNGLLVGPDEWEQKHPQLEPRRNIVDPQAILDASPDRTEPDAEVLLARNSFSSTNSSSVLSVREPGHGRDSGDIVRFKKMVAFAGFTKATLESASGYEITVTDADNYTVTITGETATSSERGGGQNATVGPVTVEA